MKDSEVRTAATAWVAGLFPGTRVVEGYPKREVEPPYIMVNMTTVSEVRQHEQKVDYTDGEEPEEGEAPVIGSPVIETEWMFSVHAYGDDPTTMLRPIRAAALLPQLDESLRPLHVHEVSAIRHVPEYVNEAWEPRAQMDLYLRGQVRDGFVVDVIETTSPFEITRV